MKLNRFFLALVVPFMALVTGCVNQLEQLPQISTEQGVYEVGVSGGDVTISFIASEDWTAKVTPGTSLDVVDDITVSPSSGSASEKVQTLTVHVGANSGYNRKALVSIIGSRLSGAATIEQAGAEGERILVCSIAEFLEKDVDASIYYQLTGEITVIANTTYSNFYMKDLDGDAEVYIYGLGYKEDPSNQKVELLVKEGIQEGDIITIASTRGQYNGTIEGMYSYYLSHEKSQKPMIKLGLESYEALAAGEEFNLEVTSNKVTWTLTSDVDWLCFEPASGSASTTVKVTVAPGEGGTGTITLSADGLESQTCTVTRADVAIIDCAGFNALPDGDKAYQISGIVTEIVMDKNDATVYNKYGNFYITDATGTVYVYGLLPEKGGAKGSNILGEKGIKVGDYITVIGPKGSYKDAPQGVNMWYSSHIQHISVAEFVALPDGDTPYVLTGSIANVVMDKNDPTKPNSYGNFDLVDETGSVYVYGLYEDYTAKTRVKVFNELGLKAGDIVTLFGPKTTYMETIEVNGSTYVMHTVGEAPAEPSIALDKESYEASAEGETFDLNVISVNASWTLSADVDWITFDPAEGDDSATVKVTVAAGEDGEGTITLSAEGLESKTCKVTRNSVTKVTCAEFNALPDGDKAYQISGVILTIVMDKNNPDQYNKYGNFYIADATGTTYVYGLLSGKGGEKGQNVLGTNGIKVGDYITVTGPKGSYKDDPQGVNMWLDSFIPSISVANFCLLEDGDTPYVLTGKIENIVMDKNDPTVPNAYGNFDLTDDSGSIYVYGLYEDYTATPRVKVFNELGLKEGDIVTLIGPKTTYKDKIEVNGSTYVRHYTPESEE